MRIRSMLGVLALSAATMTACGGGGGDGGTGPKAGLLTVTLNTAPANVGALLLTVTGGQIDGVSASGYHTYQTPLGNSSRRVLLTGSIVAGPLLQIQVPDIAQFTSYSAVIQQVSARSTAPSPYAQMSSAGMTISVAQ